MNAKQRRTLEEARSVIEEIASEERDKRENAPENLYDSERYENMEASADLLDEAVQNIEEALEY